MRRAAGWLAALLAGAAAVTGLIALLQSRDDSAVEPARTEQPPGERATPPREYAGLLRDGNVVVLHTGRRPSDLGGDSPELRQAGQAVVVEERERLPAAYVAYSATHRQAAESPGGLREFVDYWLGGR